MNCACRAFAVISMALFTVAAGLTASAAAAPTIWSGSELTFIRPGTGEPTLPESQDRIIPSVWITRGFVAGIFNVAPEQESEYDQSNYDSPIGTLWATAINNPDDQPEEIIATNWANLDFTNWRLAYDGGQSRLPDNLLAYNAVVQLTLGDPESKEDDIFFDLQFTNWQRGIGPDFSYTRGLAPRTGDYNGDTFVNAADYTIWRNTFGEYPTMRGGGADGDASGVIDMGDYFFWRDHYGVVSEGGAALVAAALPEPTAIALAIVGLFLLPWDAFRRYHRGTPQGGSA